MGIPEALGAPYPGLRPFAPDECHLFFGRELQTEELVKRLGRQRFVAVIGTSGSGKSSLVLAGLLPALHGGFLRHGTTAWHITHLRPGDRPVLRLAEALTSVPGFAPADVDRRSQVAWVESTLRRSGLGLLEATRQAHLPATSNLLVVVDQFEELFRYEPDEAAAFVRLLLEAVHQSELPIYIATTMRSDYLGECARFRDLPETLNDTQYLVPRMTRDQRRLAIEGPALVVGGRIAPALVNRLLNDAGDDPSQLPLLQHALMRTWEHWSKLEFRTEEVELEHYLAEGGLAHALANHADSVYITGLPDETHRKIAETVFKRLTERDIEHREVRRPARVDELLAVSSATPEQLATVLHAFLDEGRSFLTRSPVGAALTDNPLIDIAHESLIRCWKTLNQWAAAEAKSAEIYQRLAGAAARQATGEAGFLGSPELDLALKWKTENEPTLEWADRYEGNFAQTIAYLGNSQKEQEDARRRERGWKVGLAVAISAAVLIAILSLFAFALTSQRRSQQERADRYLREGLVSADEGDIARAAHMFAQGGAGRSDTLFRISQWLPWGRRLDETSWGRTATFNVWRYAERLPREPALAANPTRPIKVAGGGQLASERMLTWNGDGDLHLWDRRHGTVVGIVQHPRVSGALFSRSGDQVVTWSKADGDVKLWDVREGVILARRMNHQGITNAVFGEGTGEVVTWGQDGTARLWKNGGSEPRVFTHGRPVKAALLSAACRCLATWSDGETSAPPKDKDPGGYGGLTSPSPVPSIEPAQAEAKIWSLDHPAAAPKAIRQFGSIDLVFSSDGRHVLTWGTDGGTAKIWTARSMRPPTLIATSLGGEVSAKAYSADVSSRAEFGAEGRLVLTQTPRSGAQLFDTSSSKELSGFLPEEHDVQDATFLGEHLVLTRHSDEVRIWPVPKVYRGSEELYPVTLRHHGVTKWTLSPSRTYLATWSADGSVRVWRATDGRLMGQVPGSKPLKQVDFGPGEFTVLLRSIDGRIRIWNVQSGALALDVMVSNALGSVLVNDSNMLAWDEEGGAFAYTFSPDVPKTAGLVVAAAFDTEARTVTVVNAAGEAGVWGLSDDTASTGLTRFVDGSFSRFSPEPVLHPRGKYVVTWEQPAGQTNAAAQSQSSIKAASSNKLKPVTVSLFHVADAKKVQDLSVQNAAVLGAAFSADGQYLVTWTNVNARFWTMDGREAGRRLEIPEGIFGAALSPDGSTVLVWRGNGSAVLAPRDGNSQQQIPLTLDAPVIGADFSLDGRRLVVWTSSKDSAPGGARVLNVVDGKQVPGVDQEGLVLGAMFTPSGKVLTWSRDRTARLWTASDNSAGPTQPVVTIQTAAAIRGAAASHDGRFIFTWGVDGTAYLWNASDGSRASAAFRHTGVILRAQFTEDGTVVTCSTDGTIREIGNADYQFAAAALPLLASVATGAELDEHDALRALSLAQRSEKRSALRKELEEHRKDRSCPYGAAEARLLAALGADFPGRGTGDGPIR